MSLTPETLLLSLQSHLSHHANLLPQLHAQLGLPTSALADEFEQLRETLCNVVERQMTSRREEVDRWMAKCDVVERECSKYAKALGGNATRGLQSLGELRKLQVLPKRYDQLITHQERLAALYKGKVDQLSTLTNRFHNVTRTLGNAFFPPDIFESLPAQSDPASPDSPSFDPTDTESSLISSDCESSTQLVPTLLKDVTPERFQRLEKELARGKAEIQRRLTHLASLLELVVWLYTELGIDLPTPDVSAGPLPTSAPAPKAPLISEGQYEQILARFVARWEEAEDEALEGDTLGVEGVDPTESIMEWAEKLKAELDDLKTLRESQIQTIFDQLESLWKRMGVPEQEIDAFIEGNKGSAEGNVKAYEAELARMLDLKRDRMSVFIVNAREEIVELWEELILGEAERNEFTPFTDDEHTEELLARHEEEILRLKDERLIKGPLLASITKYFDICEEEKQLTESAADQSRLLGRGPRDPGRLLREEKMRKRVKKEKPKLESELLQKIPGWEERHGRQFLINGIRVVDVLMESADADHAKEVKKQAQPHVPPRATTPGPSGTTGPTPSTRKHAATPSVANSIPNKRQRLNTGAPSSTTRPSSTTPTFGVSTNTRPTPLGASSIVNSVAASSKRVSKVAGHHKSSVHSATPSQSHIKASTQKSYGTHLGIGAPASIKGRSTSSSSATTNVSSTGSRTASGPCRVAPAASGPVAAKKRTRESFRPRASIDSAVFGMGGLKNLGRVNVGGTLPGMASGHPSSLVEVDENLM